MQNKTLKPLGRARYGNPDKRERVPYWRITPKARTILYHQSIRYNASQSYIFESMMRNIMVLSSCGNFDLEIKADKKRDAHIPRINIHPIYIDFITSCTQKHTPASRVSAFIEHYQEKYHFELNPLFLS